MLSFTYHPNTASVLFGQGRIAALPEQLSKLGIRKPLIITTPAQKQEGLLLLALPGMPAGVVCNEATMHTPLEVTERSLALLQTQACDGLVAIGGGSTIGLAKALAFRTKLPQIAIPTTYAGSEVTPILGETLNGVKKTQRSPSILPNVVIYDVDFTLGLPVSMSASSGLNAIAHAVEALYAQDSNPVIDLMAEEGIRALMQSLPRIMQKPSDVDARSEAQYGAWLCGTCLGSVGMSLHHKLCHVLGGAFNLPHAETHAIVLPYALAYNAPAVPDAVRKIARAMGQEKAPWLTLHSMLKTLSLPKSLKEIGMPEDGVEQVLTLVFKDSYWNPRPLERAAIKALLEAAWCGATPDVF